MMFRYTTQTSVRSVCFVFENQLIESAGRGKLDFSLAGLREYLAEHAAIDHVAEQASIWSSRGTSAANC